MQYFIREKEVQQLEKQMGEFLLQSIIDTTGVFVCGGALTSIFSSSKINDFDLYFKARESYEILSDKLRSSPLHTIAFESSNAITYLQCVHSKSFQSKKVQLIRKEIVFAKPIEEILQKFDFSVCQAGYDFDKKMFVADPNFLYDLSKRELVFNINSSNPINTLIRLKKFFARGFTISPKELLRIALVVNKLNLKDRAVLIDNLEGLGSDDITVVKDKLEGPGEVNVEAVLEEFLNNEFFVKKPTPEVYPTGAVDEVDVFPF